VIKVLRTQFIAILGNVLLAIPTAAIIAYGWQALAGSTVVSRQSSTPAARSGPGTAWPCCMPALPGLPLPVRADCRLLRQQGHLPAHSGAPGRPSAAEQLLGKHRAWKLGHYVEHNLGALAGNFYFGLFLGLTGTIGIMLGLPLDIRHITFSAANLAFGLVTLDFQLPLGQMALYGGLALIG
jgi:site-specific recombinase